MHAYTHIHIYKHVHKCTYTCTCPSLYFYYRLNYSRIRRYTTFTANYVLYIYVDVYSLLGNFGLWDFWGFDVLADSRFWDSGPPGFTP